MLCFHRRTAWAGVSVEEFPHLKTWVYKILERPGAEKGRNVPKPHKMFDHWQKTEEELDKAAEGTRAWVQQSMQEDAKRR